MSGFAISADGAGDVNGLQTSMTGGVAGDMTITTRTRMFGGIKAERRRRERHSSRPASPQRTYPSLTASKHVIPRPRGRPAADTSWYCWILRNPGWQIDPGLATALASDLRNNWGVQPGTHLTAYDQQQMGAGTTVANGFYAASNYELADVDPDARFPLATALHAFRNQQGNPGWFTVRVSLWWADDWRHVFRFDPAGRTEPSLDGADRRGL